jgi:hypothetical protein
MPGEPLINSESFSCVGKMPERRTRSAGPVQIKAPITGKAQWPNRLYSRLLIINLSYRVAANYFTALDDPAIQAGSIEKWYKHFLVQQGLQIFAGNI